MSSLNAIFTLIFLICFLNLNAQRNDTPKYARVLLEITSEEQAHRLHDAGIHIDHAIRRENGFITVLSEQELETVRNTGIQHQVQIQDLETYHKERIEREMQDPEVKSLMQHKSGMPGFSLGSHAGFYTIAEMEAKLDEMRADYPNLITDKFSIGQSYEGRDIWAVKISDNADTDESATETAVYYDAMHHSREPLGMAGVMYYMFWLLENYNTDGLATHLVKNRELYFVPLVNPDGYQYNQDTNPTGGGMWRKNRRPNAGSSCIGTDLNRNYGGTWGGPGASTDPCNDTYRGTGAFSEPETQVVRDFLDVVNPVTSFSIHSFSEIYLHSEVPDNERQYYEDFSLDMCHEHDFAYGSAPELLYEASGGATDYHSAAKNSISYTPEIGTWFWVDIADIIPTVERHLHPLQYIATVAGSFPDIKNIEVQNDADILPDSTVILDVDIINKGMTETSLSSRVDIMALTPNVTITDGSVVIPAIGARQISRVVGDLSFEVDANAQPGDIVEIEAWIAMDGVEFEREVQRWVVGQQNTLLASDGENGLEVFQSTGTGIMWDTTHVMSREGVSIADSPIGHVDKNSDTYCTSFNVTLSGLGTPVMEYWAAWGLSNKNEFGVLTDNQFSFNDDYVRLQISTNNGVTWTNMTTDNTQILNGQPAYIGNQKWTKEIIDLSAYQGQDVEIQFLLHSGNLTETDGFYIDNFKIMDYYMDRCPDPNNPDSDGDGVCDDMDICPGGDDMLDSDFDEMPDFCDACPFDIDNDCADCPAYDFSSISVLSFDAGQDFGPSSVQDSGATLYMEGNAWKAIDISYDVTPNTVIQFDFKSTVEGEIHEVAFDNDLLFAPDHRIVVYGNQGYGGTFTNATYSGSEEWETFTVSLGANFTGLFQYLVLSADDDANAVGNSFFRNIKIFEDSDGDLKCDDSCLDINVKVFLEGPYNAATGMMNTDLNNLDILPGETSVGVAISNTPAGQPYNASPWNYAGTEGANWSNGDYASNVVDWVLVSVRSSTSVADKVACGAGLLMDDGTIVMAENCVLKHGGNDSLHLVIEHRNHMHIMTEEKIPVVNGMVTYDFTNSANPAAGINKQTPVGAGIWAMFAGDAVQEGDINGGDKIIWDGDNGIFRNYLPSDFNMDGDVSGADKIYWSTNNGEFTGVPR